MDPQRSWSQHKILAEEFCLHDEQVRLAEEVLREAQMYRSRLLAAFAVTVGRDRSAADLLGLPEREVRSARRVVGKSRARTVAGDMLDAPKAPEENRWSVNGQAAEWSKDLDVALTTGWHQGVDLHVLAAQLGTDVASVVARLKELSTQGILRGNGGATAAERRGRHRKQGGATRADPGPAPAPAPAPANPYQQPQRQPTPSQPVHQEVTDSWVAWETQLAPGPNYYSTEGAVGGVVLEGDVWSPSQYNPY